jgi:hypothetical protein
VTRHGNRDRRALKATVRPAIPSSRLDAMIEEAIVDAYNEAEQAVGFHATIEQHLALPFETVVLGTIVTVRKLDVIASGNIVAVCCRGREDRRSRFSSCRCRIRCRLDGSGSRPIVDGREDAGSEGR